VDIAVITRQHKPRPNLGRVCVTEDRPTKMRWAAGLVFPGPGKKQTESDARGPFASRASLAASPIWSRAFDSVFFERALRKPSPATRCIFAGMSAEMQTRPKFGCGLRRID
jgi:hypothetical protein